MRVETYSGTWERRFAWLPIFLPGQFFWLCRYGYRRRCVGRRGCGTLVYSEEVLSWMEVDYGKP